MEELLMVERGAFQNLPEMVKLELCNNPQLSYVDPQAFRFVRPPKLIDFKMSCCPCKAALILKSHTSIFKSSKQKRCRLVFAFLQL